MERDKLIEMYRTMKLIRRIEQRINDEYKYDEIKTPIHLSIGQEAVAAGVCVHLRKDDYIFSTHRNHAQYIAKGGNIRKMIAELYLRTTGCARGRGGSMHLVDTDVGILGSTAIVGGNIPLGTGTALASKLLNNDRVTVVFFGDGAADEGTFHESLNFAAVRKLPVVYVCENNFYAINSHQKARQAGEGIYQWGRGYGMPGYRIDGNDVLEVSEYARQAIERCRKGEGPTLLECITYRWKGHIGTVDDVGDGYRPKEEYDYWLSKCSIKRFAEFLRIKEILTDELEKAIDEEIDTTVEDAFSFAKSSPKPSTVELTEFVYVD
ncbi:dehydrogenase [Thermoclostridium stercorarium subsp. leptospartum DSM 9219]|jgi:TPP-dependent pyruvate/acetoin dehydrogenase alpha subunit|uniref:Dehydrogenase n=1 Tax=Thermoclostridium stercorarium subsp. leptospartum DSM 9219 TaxID=1346611 RepID=A0A1B1YKW9_THEST|nr:thiamine pyrophosphate-dependent dehydrogenase E1 component subunit alpha [Thermoclostridium stercorarium]ANX01437.1 dehydrogenase [Thermoclostridium stercorarium subsp. leptospartum DSM 9219]